MKTLALIFLVRGHSTCTGLNVGPQTITYSNFLPIKAVFTYIMFAILAFANVPSVTPGFVHFLFPPSVFNKQLLPRFMFRISPLKTPGPRTVMVLLWCWAGSLGRNLNERNIRSSKKKEKGHAHQICSYSNWEEYRHLQKR